MPTSEPQSMHELTARDRLDDLTSALRPVAATMDVVHNVVSKLRRRHEDLHPKLTGFLAYRPGAAIAARPTYDGECLRVYFDQGFKFTSVRLPVQWLGLPQGKLAKAVRDLDRSWEQQRRQSKRDSLERRLAQARKNLSAEQKTIALLQLEIESLTD